MEVYIPYLVLVGIVILFFIICYFVFRETPAKRKKSKAVADTPVNWQDRYDRKLDYGAEYYNEDENSHTEENNVPEYRTWQEELREQTPEPELQFSVRESVLEPVRETMREPIVETEPLMDEDTTLRHKVISKPVDTLESDATIIMPRVTHTQENDLAEFGGRSIETEPASMPLFAQEEEVPGLKHFINLYGSLSETTHYQVVSITREAFQRLGLENAEETRHLLENIVVQEALLCMQKAYAATPTDWMKDTALEAFTDVVQQPKSSTPYLVAFDALHILPHLTLGHFQAMAIVLLLRYSRNSNNYSIENFRHYANKYIEPFLSDLGHTDSLYRQLDYLRCTVNETKPTNLQQILSDVYPFVFNYRGFSLDELDEALNGQDLDDQFIVDSINSPLYKLAVVDEGLAVRLFRLAKINDSSVQDSLLRLMKSKPISIDKGLSREILEDISPSLLELERIYDTTSLSRVSLTLMGLYLARAHVKTTIGEDFDLSRWF